jgi:hypothetical protein
VKKDLPASVRQRLMNHAKAANRPFQEVLQYYAMERFLYRLAQSRHADNFVLKGALMFTAWGGPASRPTKDIDFLARMDNAVESVVAVIRDVCALIVEPDGLVFDAGSEPRSKRKPITPACASCSGPRCRTPASPCRSTSVLATSSHRPRSGPTIPPCSSL